MNTSAQQSATPPQPAAPPAAAPATPVLPPNMTVPVGLPVAPAPVPAAPVQPVSSSATLPSTAPLPVPGTESVDSMAASIPADITSLLQPAPAEGSVPSIESAPAMPAMPSTEVPPTDVATPPTELAPEAAASQSDVSPATTPPAEIEAITPLAEPATTPEEAAVAPVTPTPQTLSPTTTDESSSSDSNERTVTKGKYTNLLEVLTATGGLSQEVADEIRVENISTGKSVESLLEEKNLVTEEVLTRAKAELHSVPFVKMTEVGTDPEAISQLPEGSARHYQMVPFAYNKQDGTLSVAMKDPLDLTAIDFAQQKTNLRILAHYAMPSEVERAIAEFYSQTLSSEVTAALEQTTQVAETQAKKQNLSQLAGETIRSAPITKIVETMVTFAIKARASDIHVEPLEDRTRIRYRIDGILNEKLILPKSVHDAVVSRIKILSGLKIDEKRLPQDGRFNFNLDEQEVDLRISTLPTIHGEKIVMRLLKKDMDVPTLEDLGLNGLALHNVEKAIKVPHGIVLITGPTGSGKTTTLYSILHKINSAKVNIMTLEDPVEYQITGVNQVQVNPQAGLTFASGLRSFLRQDPNIIMVGEIRDSETAELAIQAALTGHLVFSTLHTSSAAGALPRLMDMGAEPFLLASSMTCVMAQRVLRKINEAYKEEFVPDPAVIKDIQDVLGEKFIAWCKQNNKDPKKITLFRPKADRPQNEPEYKGRIAIFEVMRVTEEISRLILERQPASEMEKLALRDGMFFMKQDGYIKALEGVTTIEEVLRVAQI